ncbi:MAG: DASS family sodium-coupled anion symporter [Gemmatimonadales bacterium]
MPDTPPLLGTLSPAEERFEAWRGRVGFVLAPAAAIAIALLDLPTLSPEAHRLASVMVAVVVLWITESIPMPVTALLGASACVILGVAPAKAVFAPFADPLMFLFIGSFILSQGIFHHGLDRRVAFTVLSRPWVGASPSRLLLAFGLITALISGWISNTATTAMMFGIGMSILRVLYLRQQSGELALDPRWASGLMLMTSFAASIGGLMTPVGTPPNVIGLGFIRSELGVQIPFFSWMLLGVPTVAMLFVVLFLTLRALSPSGVAVLPGGASVARDGLAGLGPWRPGERSVLWAFLVTVVLWITPGVLAIALGERAPLTLAVQTALPEGVAALLGATLLFLLPGAPGQRALTWPEASKIDWGVVLLYGGGFALGTLAFQTGLAEALGRGVTGWIPNAGEMGLLVMGTIVATLLSETTSNTAAANMVVPVIIAIANSSGVDPLLPALGATLGSSLGFMLPVSTPCNAIVYGSGMIPLSRMMRAGLILDLVGIVVVIGVVALLGPLLR